jgi:hypothetical protein
MDQHDGNMEGTSMTDGTSMNDRLAALEGLLKQQDERMARQEAEIEHLRAALAETQAEAVQSDPAVAPGGLASRRTLLKLGGAAAVAGVAAGAASALANHAQAAPATVNQWTTSTFTIDAETVVKPGSSSYTGTDILQLQVGTGSVYSALGSQLLNTKAALTAYDTTTTGVGVYGSSSTGFGLFGVTGTGTGATGAGLNGTANATGTGVSGNSGSGIGVQGNSTNFIGGSFTGGLAPLYLGPAGASGAPSSGTHAKGEIFLDLNASVWVCVGGGIPGTWVRLGAVATSHGGAINYLSSPIRVLAALNGASGSLVNRPALGPLEIFALPVAGLSGSGIPSTAQGLIANVTVLGPSQGGNLSLFPTGAPIPTVASMTYGQGMYLANGVNVAIGTGGQVNIQNQSSGTTPLVLDAVAYVS